ncbi:heptaprenyl diphosphate synthase component 1 [Bhargavaea ullalensis]|uniref:Heptaprenyl diphosphate synthase n=1 Tax=Bhargavaea ullalensis TaxID=1265685 RepID=A0ABV2GA29_9BACL
MNASPIHIEVEQLKTDIQRRLADRMLLEHTGEPAVGSPVLFALVLPGINGEEWRDEDRLAATAVGALHAAFHAHDSIEDRGTPSRRQQLTVLAGDYYSGVHYRILTGIPDVGLLRDLALAVIRMSECKAALYEHEQARTAGEVAGMLPDIEAAALSAFFRNRGLSLYGETVRNALTAKRLECEIEHLDSGRITPFCTAILESADIQGDNVSARRFMESARLEAAARGMNAAVELSRAGRLPAIEISCRLGLGEPAPTQSGKKV